MFYDFDSLFQKIHGIYTIHVNEEILKSRADMIVMDNIVFEMYKFLGTANGIKEILEFLMTIWKQSDLVAFSKQDAMTKEMELKDILTAWMRAVVSEHGVFFYLIHLFMQEVEIAVFLFFFIKSFAFFHIMPQKQVDDKAYNR